MNPIALTGPALGNDSVLAQEFDYYGDRLAVACADHIVRIYERDPVTNTWLFTDECKGHKGPVLGVSWAHPEYGVAFASCSTDRRVIIWEQIEDRSRSTASSSSAAAAVATSINSNVQQQFKTQGKKWVERHVITHASGSVSGVAFSPYRIYKPYLATVSSDGNLRIYNYTVALSDKQGWELRAVVQLSVGSIPEYDGMYSISWCPDLIGKQMIAVGLAGNDKGNQIDIYLEPILTDDNSNSNNNTTSNGGEDLTQYASGIDAMNNTEWAVCSRIYLNKGCTVRDVNWAPSMGRSYHLIAVGSNDGGVRVFRHEFDIGNPPFGLVQLDSQQKQQQESASGSVRLTDSDHTNELVRDTERDTMRYRDAVLGPDYTGDGINTAAVTGNDDDNDDDDDETDSDGDKYGNNGNENENRDDNDDGHSGEENADSQLNKKSGEEKSGVSMSRSNSQEGLSGNRSYAEAASLAISTPAPSDTVTSEKQQQQQQQQQQQTLPLDDTEESSQQGSLERQGSGSSALTGISTSSKSHLVQPLLASTHSVASNESHSSLPSALIDLKQKTSPQPVPIEQQPPPAASPKVKPVTKANEPKRSSEESKKLTSIHGWRLALEDTAHIGDVWRVAWNITGTRLVSTGDDGTARLYCATPHGKWECIGVVSAYGEAYDP
ncbi:WD40 repeat-like protein [Ramicandelaber brevisporus]|nr:WD40 repeat-like protein [Ramicandelaber brevisporus]